MSDDIRYADYLARAVATPGGHLSIGRGGFILHFEHSRLSGYDCETNKAAAVAAGFPVIDSRMARLLVESGRCVTLLRFTPVDCFGNRAPATRLWIRAWPLFASSMKPFVDVSSRHCQPIP